MRAVRFLGAALLACASIPVVGAGAAHADTASLTPSNAAYFNRLGIDKPEESPAAPPNVTSNYADGVAAGHLAVAASGGQEDKVSFLYFDVFALPEGITISKAVVTMRTVDNPPEDISVQATPDKVSACQAGDQGFSGDDGSGMALAPARLCDAFTAKGTAGTAPGTYQWDITGLAQTWLTGSNDGVAFTRSDAAPNSSFQVVFDEPSTASLQVEYTLPPPLEPVPPFLPPTAPEVPNVGAAPLPPVDGGFVPEPAAPLAPNPAVNNPPAPVGGNPGATPVALSTSLRPENPLWLAALALAGTLLLLSLVLGDPQVSSSARRTSRLSQALAGRSRLAPVGVMRPRHL